MAKEIYEMMQERAKITAQLREVMNRNDAEEMNADDKATYDRLEKEFDKLNTSITREQKQLERERAAGEVAEVQRDNAKNKIVVRGILVCSSASSAVLSAESTSQAITRKERII